ncbi:MAG: dihydropteroate synthase [Verrucomicrobiota bacterium]
MIWRTPSRSLDLSQHAQIMGILNATPDSFSDGGQFLDPAAALSHAQKMLEEGAHIIDVGGESTRPGAPEVTADDELARTIPVIKAIKATLPDALVSIDTSKAAVAEAALDAGAEIINDVSGLAGDPEMIALAARTKAAVVIMHMQGNPRTMQKAPQYKDVVAEVRAFFNTQFERASKGGISPEAILFDPGIGFGKSLEHNLSLLRNLSTLPIKNRPLLLGVSRKSFLGRLIGSDTLDDRFWPTVALASFAREQGSAVRVLRVHDVAPNTQALQMTEAILASQPPPC